MTLSAGVLVGPYVIERFIGSGAMGEVYCARDPRLDRRVALEVLPRHVASEDAWLRRFEQEGRAAAALNHPNVVAVFDVGLADGTPYVVSELLEGQTLRARMMDADRVVPARAVDIVRQMAAGLAAAHARGIVHRELTPENVFITTAGLVKILDFGLARREAPRGDSPPHDPLSATRTDPGTVVGTPAYLSPEQIRGERADVRTDLFALGVIAYELLTGAHPFTGGSSADTMAAILQRDPPPFPASSPTLPHAIERIVGRCLEKVPADRFQSAGDLAFALETVSSVSSGTSATTRLGARRSPAFRMRVAGAMAAAIVAGVLGFAAGSQRPAAANEARARSFRPVTFQRGHLTAARFAGDGIVYSAAWNGEARRVYMTQRDRPEARLLELPPAGLHAVSPEGELAVALDCAWEQRAPACAGRLAIVPPGGAPREVAANVVGADWTRDGRTLVIARRLTDGARLEAPPGRVVYESTQLLSHPRVSHDGRSIAVFEHPREPGLPGVIILIDVHTRARRVVTSPRSFVTGIAWTPDDHELWFSSGQLYAVTPDTGAPGSERPLDRQPRSVILHDLARDGRTLITLQENNIGIVARGAGDTEPRNLSWFDSSHLFDLSRDGRFVLFDERGSAMRGVWRTYLRAVDGSPAIRLAEGQALALSPDASVALVQRTGGAVNAESETAPSSGDLRRVLVPIGAGSERVLRRGPIVEYFPTTKFFPDGQHLLLFGRAKGEGLRAWKQALDGTDPVPLTSEVTFDHACISPDGRWIVAERIGDPAPVRLAVDGSGARPIVGLRAREYPLSWTDDGRDLVVLQYFGTSGVLYRLDPETGRRAHLANITMPDPAGLLSIQRIKTARDGAVYAFQYNVIRNQLFVVEGLQ